MNGEEKVLGGRKMGEGDNELICFFDDIKPLFYAFIV